MPLRPFECVVFEFPKVMKKRKVAKKKQNRTDNLSAKVLTKH